MVKNSHNQHVLIMHDFRVLVLIEILALASLYLNRQFSPFLGTCTQDDRDPGSVSNSNPSQVDFFHFLFY